jgi:uncharacterized protein YdeI (BOF family)
MDCETTLKGELMKKFAAIAAIMMMTTAPVFAAQGGLTAHRHTDPDANSAGRFCR